MWRPTKDKILSLLDFDPYTGFFTWKKRTEDFSHTKTWNKRWANKLAGELRKDGYIGLTILCHKVLAHRVAWFLVYGYWANEIDHKNGVRSDNRIQNLRSATRTLNIANSTRDVRQKKTGMPKGVELLPHGSYRVTVQKNGKRHRVMCLTMNEAKDAYLAKAKELFGDFARGG